MKKHQMKILFQGDSIRQTADADGMKIRIISLVTAMLP